MTDVPSIASGIPVSEGKAPAPALVEKYESGSGRNKIHVRIFKEPMTEPITPDLQEDTQIKQGDTNTDSKNGS